MITAIHISDPVSTRFATASTFLVWREGMNASNRILAAFAGAPER